MKKFIVNAILFSFISGLASTANAAYFWTDYTLSKNCGRDGIYAGPAKPEQHGGVCLYFSEDVFKIHTSYTEDKNCNYGGVYGGPNRADLHGGTCIWAEGYTLQTTYTTTKVCGQNGTYIGPDRADVHGGYCLEIVE